MITRAGIKWLLSKTFKTFLFILKMNGRIYRRLVSSGIVSNIVGQFNIEVEVGDLKHW